MFQRILIATDGSENSKRASKAGIEIAKSFGGKVTVLFVADPRRYFTASDISYNIVNEVIEGAKKEVMKEGDAAISQVEEDAKLASVPLEKKIVEGYPADEILKLGSNMDLIVIGKMGRTGLPKFLIGSIADKVINNSTVPVHIVP